MKGHVPPTARSHPRRRSCAEDAELVEELTGIAAVYGGQALMGTWDEPSSELRVSVSVSARETQYTPARKISARAISGPGSS